MNFELILEELLLEMSGEEVYKKYYSNIPRNVFNLLVSADAGTVAENGELIKIGKHVKLLVKLWRTKKLPLEDLQRAKEYISIVYKYNVPIDINKINELGDLHTLLKPYIAKESKSLKDILDNLSPDEYKLLYDGRVWMIYQPLTEKAACGLGAGTEWCTAWGPHSYDARHKEKTNHFNSHAQRGPLYVVIDKEDNKKFQIHFETKQFMDILDKRISIQKLLDDNLELKYFFFPSLSKGWVNEKTIDKEMSRLDFLSPESSLELLNIYMKNEDMNNELVRAILMNDEAELNLYIKDSILTEEVSIGDTDLFFKLESLSDDMESTSSTMDYYLYEIYNAYSSVYDQINDRFYGYTEKEEEIEPIFNDYYKNHQNELRKELGVYNYEEFKESFLMDFVNNNKTMDVYVEEIVDKSTDNYEDAARMEVDGIQKYIDFRGTVSTDYRVDISKTYFIRYLLNKNIYAIGDEFGESLSDIIDNYISHYDLPQEYEGIYDYQVASITYSKGGRFVDYMNDYFEKLMDDEDSIAKRCLEVKEKFWEIKRNILKDQKELTTDDGYIIRLESEKVDCETESIEISRTNKETGEKIRGKVKVDNLVNYLTNYQLFESYIKFKKSINYEHK